jgi:hypothetical protein
MVLWSAERQGDLLDGVVRFCDRELSPSSVYALLHRERDRLFPDELFADLFSEAGRRSVPPSVVATVMVLQRLDGLKSQVHTVPAKEGATAVRTLRRMTALRHLTMLRSELPWPSIPRR